MDKSDIAGILGLLLGGAGGYYGGKKRGEREDKKLADYFDMMRELEGGSDGTTNTVPEVDLGPTEAVKVLDPDYGYTGETMNMLIDNLPNTRFGSTTDTYDDPLAEYFRDDDKAINTEDLAPLLEDTAPIYGDPNSSFKESFGPGLEFLFNLTNDGNLPQAHDYMQLFKADGGRVGLANGGLGYSYKNNIFSADPSTGIPAVVDNDDDGVANQTFMNLFPGLFPPVETPAENILDTPVMPMGGGGGGENNPFSNNYTGDPNIPFGENPMYGPSSGYDPDDPENSFLDKLGYGFFSNVMKPGATMMKKNPLSLANMIGSVFSDKTDKTDKTNTGSQGDGGSGGINSKDPKGGIGGATKNKSGPGKKGPGSIHG